MLFEFKLYPYNDCKCIFLPCLANLLINCYTNSKKKQILLSENKDITYYIEDYYVHPNGQIYDWEIAIDGHYTFNDNFNSEIINRVNVPRHNLYTAAKAGLQYTNDRNTFNAGLTASGGARIKFEPHTVINNDVEMSHRFSCTQDPFYPGANGYNVLWDDIVNGNEMLEVTGEIYNIVDITDKTDLSQKVQIHNEFKPTYIPRIDLGGFANWNINPTITWGVEGGAAFEFGQNGTSIMPYVGSKISFKVK